MTTPEDLKARAERAAEWTTIHEQHSFAPDVWLNIYFAAGRYRWEVFATGPDHGCKGKGIEPTQEKARQAAVEEALKLGYGKEG